MHALTLSRRDFREYDSLINLYTKEVGKLEAVARGVKKIISKNASALEPFALIEIEIASGRGLTYVTKAQVVEPFTHIRSDLDKILICSYCLNLVNEITQPGERDERVFDLMLKFLVHVDSAAEVNMSVVYDFLFRFLGLLGFAPPRSQAADSTIISYAEHHLNRKVIDIASLREKLYNLQNSYEYLH